MKFLKKIVGKGNPGMLIEAGSDVYKAYNEYTKVIEEERTKRLDSDNQARVNIESINAQKEVLLTAINKQHENSSHSLKKIFEVVDSALETGDQKQLEIALRTIIHVTENSSLKQISQLMNDIKDPNKTIDI